MTYGEHIFQRNNGIFYFRQVITISSKTREIRISLRTDSRIHAAILASLLSRRVKELMNLHHKTHKDIDSVLAEVKEELLKITAQNYPQKHDQALQMFSMIEKKFQWVKEFVSTEYHGQSADHIIATYDEYFPIFERVRVETDSANKKVREADILTMARKAYGMLEPHVKSDTTLSKHSHTYRITDVISKYESEMLSAGNWTDKTYRENHATNMLFVNLVGDKELNTLETSDVREFKECIRNLPVNHSKLKKTRYTPVTELVKQDHNHPTLSITSINKHLEKISTLLRWAERNGYVEKNVASGITIKQNKRSQESRYPFSASELTEIFSTSIYKENNHQHSYYFWLPLLALFTGARINELCQLRLEDINFSSDIPYIDINAKNGNKLKNPSARRLIPIHKTLIDIGFITFVENSIAVEPNNERLFPSITPGRDGYGTAPSKWFGRHKKKLHLDSANKKAFHSFRHNFSDALQAAGVPEQIAARLLGHQHSEISYGTYGSGPSIDQLSKFLNMIQYELPKVKFDQKL
jgi:integrase